MIDLHSHILPGVDDGSSSPKETADMLKLLVEQGVTTLAATPHFYPHNDTPEAFLERRAKAAEKMPSVEGAPELLLGAEVAYFSGIGCSEEIVSLKIGDTKLLLIEMPFTPWSGRMIDDICDIPQQLHLTPVLAHIDRYLGKQQLPMYLPQLTGCGIHLQCNADSLLSWKTRRKILKLLRNGNIQFLGSDCHNLENRPPRLDEAIAVIDKHLGTDYIAEFSDYAERLLKL